MNARQFEPPRRSYTIMSREDCEKGKQSYWSEMEIRGPIKNLSPDLWTFTHLTALYLSGNNLQVSQRVCVCVCVCVLVVGECVILCRVLVD